MIGISVEGKAKVGVIGKYFRAVGVKKYNWRPRCYFSHAENFHVYYFDYLKGNSIVELIRKEPEDKDGFNTSKDSLLIYYRLTICTSKNLCAVKDFQHSLDMIHADHVSHVGSSPPL